MTLAPRRSIVGASVWMTPWASAILTKKRKPRRGLAHPPRHAPREKGEWLLLCWNMFPQNRITFISEVLEF